MNISQSFQIQIILFLIIQSANRMAQQRILIPRKTGQLTQRKPRGVKACSTVKKIEDITVNNINLYTEASCLNNERNSIFHQYEEIITELQKWNQQLSERNYFLQTDRKRLMDDNFLLRKQLDGQSYGNLRNHDPSVANLTYKRQRKYIFEIISEQLDAQQNFNQNKFKGDIQILEQSDFELDALNTKDGHYYDDNNVDNRFQFELQASSRMVYENESEQKTPCLNRNYSTIQCEANEDSPLRIFYILLLQYPKNLSKLESILQTIIKAETPLFPLYKADNKIWSMAIIDFLDKIRTGQLDNEQEVISFINQNPLIDKLLIECLKSVTYYEREEEIDRIDSENESKILFYSESSLLEQTKTMNSHEVLFRGLANYFELQFEEDRKKMEYRFYQLPQKQRELIQSDQLLLSSRQIEKISRQQQLQISLHPQPHLKFSSIANSTKQEPIFKIRFDLTRKHYRVLISIRNIYNEEQCEQFSQCQSNQQHDLENSEEQSFSNQYKDYNRELENPLGVRDQNVPIRHKKTYHQNTEYLQIKFDSNYASYSGSKQNSLAYDQSC